MIPTRYRAPTRRGTPGWEIRNPNVEIRNKFETRMTETNLHRTTLPSGVAFQPFGIRICFGFRISSFEFSATSRPTDMDGLESPKKHFRWS